MLWYSSTLTCGDTRQSFKWNIVFFGWMQHTKCTCFPIDGSARFFIFICLFTIFINFVLIHNFALCSAIVNEYLDEELLSSLPRKYFGIWLIQTGQGFWNLPLHNCQLHYVKRSRTPGPCALGFNSEGQWWNLRFSRVTGHSEDQTKSGKPFDALKRNYLIKLLIHFSLIFSAILQLLFNIFFAFND